MKIKVPNEIHVFVDAAKRITKDWFIFLRALKDHTDDTGNPHEVTAAQTGADSSGTAAALVAAHNGETTGVHGVSSGDVASTDYVDAVASALASHATDTDNPHSVSAAQANADPAGTAASAVSSHAGVTTNVHSFDADGKAVPSAHASIHQNGGTDEVATATPAVNAIPKAGAGGTIASGWLPDLSATYAVASKGVTNGNAHDHNGGDGGQIDHVNLANKGSNTHAQIDTFVASKAAATGLASLDASSKVVQDPASAKTDGSADSIVKLDVSADVTLPGGGRIADHSVTDGGIELGTYGSGDRPCLLDFHAQDGVDYNLRIVRWAGANNNTDIRHTGTGTIAIVTEDAGSFSVVTNSTTRVTVDSDGKTRCYRYSTSGDCTLEIAGVSSPLSSMSLGTAYGAVRIYADGDYGMFIGSDSSGVEWVQVMRADSAVAYGLQLQPKGGGVGVGVAPSVELHIRDTDSADPELRIDSTTYDPTLRLTDANYPTSEGLKLWYDNDVGAVYFDSMYTGANGSIYFRTATSGTPVEGIEIAYNGTVTLANNTTTIVVGGLMTHSASGVSGPCASFENSGDNAANRGIRIRCGKNTPTANADCVWSYLNDGDNDAVAYIGYSTSSPYAAFYSASDRRFKENWKDSEVKALDAICHLKFREFDYSAKIEGTEIPSPHAKRPHQDIGLIAQEVPPKLRHIVSEDKDGYLMIAPAALTLHMAKAIRELRDRGDVVIAEAVARAEAAEARVAVLEAQAATFEARIAALEAAK